MVKVARNHRLELVDAGLQLIFIDLFCGAGGVTTGIERAKAFGKKLAKVIACVNHDPVAIKSHAYNHKKVLHFVEDIRTLDLTQLRLLVDYYRKKYPLAKFAIWASLECTNFSRAKGGKPRDADSRTLAEHLFRYIDELDPEYVMIENVEEFMSWGPLDEKGKPISKHEGRDFIRWKQDIESRGFRYDHRLINAADHGAYTKRIRYFAQFAKGDLPISWPEPTHSKNGSNDMFGGLKKWNAVKECLDFNDEGKSVFNRKKPLSSKSMQRFFMGCVKHIAGGKEAYEEQKVFISKYFSGKPMDKNISVEGPAGVIKCKDSQSLVFINKYNSNNQKTGTNSGVSIEEPAPAVTCQVRMAPVFITKAFSANSNKSVNSGQGVEEPGPAVTVQNRLGLARICFVSRYNGVNGGKHDNSQSVEGPIGALGTGDNQAKLSAQFMALYYSGGGQDGSIEEPSPTIPTKDRITKVHADFAGGYILNPSWGEGHTSGMDQPCPVVIARQDKAPLYYVMATRGPVAVPVYDTDCEWTVKLKEFMAAYGIADIKMRMLKVPELLRIQGFPRNYYLAGTQADQKKFIGNSVVPHVAEAIIRSVSISVKEYQMILQAA